MGNVLNTILDTVDLEAVLYFQTDFRPPFGVRVPQSERTVRFHLIVGGACIVTLENGMQAWLQVGDLALLPHGSPHVLSSGLHIGNAPLPDLFAIADNLNAGPIRIGAGPDAQACRMICGHFNIAAGTEHPLMRALPALIHITAHDRMQRPMLDEVVGLITRCMAAAGSGAAASVSRLSEVLFIEVMDACTTQTPEIARIMTAVHDPQIGRALSLIHQDVATAWTVARLASAAAMSRSRFAERFRDLVGLAPMSYVAEWRLQKALRLLNSGGAPVKVVAGQVGFRSAAAFTRAFSERFGMPPARLRKLGSKA